MTKRQHRAPESDDSWLEGNHHQAVSTLVDKHGLALMTGLSPKEIDKALRDGMPSTGRRERGTPLQFSVPDCVQWLLRKRDQDGDTLESAKRKERAAMARRREIEADKLEGQLCAIEEVEAAITDQVQKLQAELSTIPARLAVPPEIRDLVRAEIVACVGRLTLQGRGYAR